MEKSKSRVTNYINWLANQYQTLQHPQTQHDFYRVVEIEHSKKTDDVKLIIQVIGKSTFFKATPKELAADDTVLEKFSKKDVRTITYFACGEIKKPKYKIFMHEFCEKLNKMVFSLHKRGEKHLTTKTADEISRDKGLLQEVSQEDAHLIGYTTATEQMLQEKGQIEKLQAQMEKTAYSPLS